MKRTAMTTRAEALKIARYMGCSGAHETENGWMPCSSDSILMDISNQAEKSLARQVVSKRKKRAKKPVSNRWENLTERPITNIDTLSDGSLVSGVIGTKAANSKCPEATQSVVVNLKNRQKAIRDAKYGPLNPNEPSTEYWKDIANVWDVSLPEAKKQRCGNCAAFVKTPEMLSCINTGIGNDKDSWSVIAAGDLGYCEFFDFKCASKRTCKAWVVGGPITGNETKQLSERTVRRSDLDVFGSPESARARARQIGCIGIRRYSSDNGKPAFMPCTNESDYRRRMGTSEQGRIDIAKRQMREMRLAIGKIRSKSAASTPAPKKDQIFGSDKNQSGSASSRSSASEITLSESTVAGLKRSLQAHNRRMSELNKPSWTTANLDALKAVYRRGAGAYSSSHRPNVTRSQWAMGRVRAFLWMLERGKPKKLAYITDNDLLPEKHPFRQNKKTVNLILQDLDFANLEYKGLGNWFRGVRPSRIGSGRKLRNAAPKRPKSSYDGDGDGFIWNPLSGRDDLPFNAPKIPGAGGTTPGAKPQKMRTVLARIAGKKRQKPKRENLFAKPDIRKTSNIVRAESFDFEDEDFALNFGLGATKFPSRVPIVDSIDFRGFVQNPYWVRDEFAQKLGDYWIAGRDVPGIRPVPSIVPFSLRQWNGLHSAERHAILDFYKREDSKKRLLSAVFDTEDDEEIEKLAGKKPRLPKNPKQAQEYLNQRTHRKLAAIFPHLRDGLDADGKPIRAPAPGEPLIASMDDIKEFLKNTPSPRKFSTSDNFDYVLDLLAPIDKFAIQAHFFQRDRNLENPNRNHGYAPFLSDREFWDFVSINIGSILGKAEEENPGLSMDRLTRDKIDKHVNRELESNVRQLPVANDVFAINRAIYSLLFPSSDKEAEDDIRDIAEYNGEQEKPIEEKIAEIRVAIASGFNKDYAELYMATALSPDEKDTETKKDLNPLYEQFLDAEAPMPADMPNATNDPDFRPYVHPMQAENNAIFNENEEEVAREALPAQERWATMLDANPDNAALNQILIPEGLEQMYPANTLGNSFREMAADIAEWYEQIFNQYENLLKSTDSLTSLSTPDPTTASGRMTYLLAAISFMPSKLKFLGLEDAIKEAVDDDEPFAGANLLPMMFKNMLGSMYWAEARKRGLLD